MHMKEFIHQTLELSMDTTDEVVITNNSTES